MNRKGLEGLLLGAVGIALSTAVSFGAQANSPQPATQPADQQSLQSQVNDLKAQVAQLKSLQNQQDISAATNAVIADADKHSQFLDAGAGLSSGWDPTNYRFIIASEDGNFTFHPGIILQFRYVSSYRSAPSNWQDGFEVRRLKLYADGNLFTKDLTYKVQLQNSNGPSGAAVGGNQTIEYAWGQYIFAHNMWGGDWGIRAGQMKNPVFHEEEAVGDNNQPLVERSLVDNLVGGNALGGPYVQGIDLLYTGGGNPIHTHFLFTDGDATGNTDFTNVSASIPPSTSANTQKFGVGVRADYKVFGDWADNTDLTGKNSGKHDFLAVGAGVNFSQSSTTTTAPATFFNNTVRWDVDATFMKAQQFIIFGGIYGDYIAFSGTGAPGPDRTDIGEIIEGGYFLSPAFELVARADVTEFDHRFRAVGLQDVDEFGIGVNYFLGQGGEAGNHAKVAFDVDYLPNGTPAVTGLGYQASTGYHDEVVFRTLFQIWF
jgi:hypothetical protein